MIGEGSPLRPIVREVAISGRGAKAERQRGREAEQSRERRRDTAGFGR